MRWLALLFRPFPRPPLTCPLESLRSSVGRRPPPVLRSTAQAAKLFLECRFPAFPGRSGKLHPLALVLGVPLDLPFPFPPSVFTPLPPPASPDTPDLEVRPLISLNFACAYDFSSRPLPVPPTIITTKTSTTYQQPDRCVCSIGIDCATLFVCDIDFFGAGDESCAPVRRVHPPRHSSSSECRRDDTA